MIRLRTLSIVLFLLVFVMAASCSSPVGETGKGLEKKVEALEKKVTTLEKAMDKRLLAIEKKQQVAENKAMLEKDASKALSAITVLISKDDIEGAKKSLGDFFKKYGTTRVAKRAIKIKNELAVIGKDAPKDWGIEKWFQGKDKIDLASKEKTTLVVFWETWCPHCRNEAPKIQDKYDSYQDSGLQVIGVTKINKSATEEKVVAFIAEKDLNYPMAKENGSLTKYFNVSGIPAAALVSKGKVVWRGHPARLNDKSLKGFLGISE